jgi:hypothetical protein
MRFVYVAVFNLVMMIVNKAARKAGLKLGLKAFGDVRLIESDLGEFDDEF